MRLAQEHLPQLRAVLMLKSGLLHHALIARNGHIEKSVSNVIERSSKQLCQFANSLGSDIPPSCRSTRTHGESLHPDEVDDTERRLITSLEAVMEQITAI